ncbi:hypothetical protein [Chroococcidiopsis sp. CCNUC1]|jgi:hypothetical protein|uniref:hypothetical protein n=1 Tax=Chroococcidiopsis sp. CCNUC1 TaxID=2653189 RepID=UPI0020200EFB|nr:hypothetical protein [Chroococcidiopsis sp. CCNUC1]URD52978.1 hypothetical protein M5J74_13465 [Chroococcidiopsis sp. CCNUC1]
MHIPDLYRVTIGRLVAAVHPKKHPKLLFFCCAFILSAILPFSFACADLKTDVPQRGGGNVIFGVNDGTGYDDSQEFSQMVSGRISALGLTAVRTGADKMKCEREGEPCDFSRRDVVIQEHLAKGLALHMVIAFRWELDVAGYEPIQWTKNYAWKCGQVAHHWKDTVRYYIVDNEPDIRGRDAKRGPETPATVVRMQKACYEAIKRVDPGILVESAPATRPNTEYNRALLKAGIGKYADLIGTHMYGGQLREDAIATLRKWMAEFGVNKPVAISECGSDPNWFNPGGSDGEWKGKHGREARALWLRDMAAYARRKKLHNVLFFSMFSIHGDWEMDKDRAALAALKDIGHGRF